MLRTLKTVMVLKKCGKSYEMDTAKSSTDVSGQSPARSHILIVYEAMTGFLVASVIKAVLMAYI